MALGSNTDADRDEQFFGRFRFLKPNRKLPFVAGIHEQKKSQLLRTLRSLTREKKIPHGKRDFVSVRSFFEAVLLARDA